MAAARLRRAVGPLATLLLCSSLLPAPAGAQTAAECMQPAEPTPEDFGPTDISATSGNQRLSAALNPEGTVTVLRWPSPSYYDQIKYRTVDRDQPHMGSLPNEGAFIGIAWRKSTTDEWEFAWMRNALSEGWDIDQRYADDDSDVVVTEYVHPGAGLTVTMRDVVASDADALVRRLTVSRTAGSDAHRVRLFTFANFNPVFSKARQAPYQDWCSEERNDSGATYDESADAIVAERSGIDESTGRPSSVALAMGFLASSSQFQVGQDSYAASTPGTSAYDDATDGELSGVPLAAGQADGALARDLDLRSEHRATAAVAITAGPTEQAAVQSLGKVRDRGAQATEQAKKRWWRSWLEDTKLPDASLAIRTMAKRALISIRQSADRHGLIVGSIATQPSLSVDVVAEGAFVNRALDVAGLDSLVRKHNIRYAELQATAAGKPPGGEATPPGNWSESFYADGVVSGPVPYEIDSTGLGLWTLWDHYRTTKDDAYLLRVYESIQRGAQYLTDVCRDPSTGLQCAAPDSENPNPTLTLRGAQAVWLGLDSAARAAEVKAKLQPSTAETALANAKRWRDRRDEIADAILDFFYERDCRCFTQDPEVGGTFLWPGRAIDYAGTAANDQANENWTAIAPALGGSAEVGGSEVHALLGNAFEWPLKTRRDELDRGLRWVERVPTTDETQLLGMAWMDMGTAPGRGDVVTMQGQPYVPVMARFYLAAMKVYGKTSWTAK